MGALFTKPKNVRWVDMAIWIDENFYKENCDYDTAYAYMYLLASMLAAKRRYFDNARDYDEFASYLAYDTFKRMSDESKSPIKSVLNYMKSILSFRRMGYNHQKRQKIIDPVYDQDWDSTMYVEYCKDAYESSFNDELYNGVCETLAYAPKYINDCIPNVYKLNKLEYKNIYMSCILSMINNITLPEIVRYRFESKLNNQPLFDETKYYAKYLDKKNILWHLTEDYNSLISVILNKVQIKLINEIKELSNSIKISPEDFNNILFSGFSSGDKNEANN